MKLLVCLTGASGAMYGQRLLHWLGELHKDSIEARKPIANLEVAWVASKHAEQVWQEELQQVMPSVEQTMQTGFRRWSNSDFSAPFASGSNPPDAVIVAPCSMSSLARIAHGGGHDLIDRSCQVALKERRPLILMIRETPLSRIHLRNMLLADAAGATILPAIPAFYSGIQTMEQAIDTVLMRALDHVGIHLPLVRRWGE